MATFNGGRMVALFLSVLFALNVSFAQDGRRTVILYMEDPIPVDEQLAEEAKEYLDKLNDPFTWETEQDFQDARDAQIAQVERDNATRKQKAVDFLMEDIAQRGDGTSSWYPSWIPLGFAKTSEDSLFKNAVNLPGGRRYITGPKAGQPQTLREFFELDGSEPYRDSPDYFRKCDDEKPRCRKEFYAHFRELVEIYDASQVSPDSALSALISSWPLPPLSPSSRLPSLLLPDVSLPYEVPPVPPSDVVIDVISPLAAPRIISFTIEAASTFISPTPGDSLGFVDELNEERTGDLEPLTFVDFDWGSIRLLQEATIDPDSLSFHVRPAAKPVSSSETSSWGRIKATFAD